MELVGISSYEGKLWKRLVFPVIYCALWMIAEGLVFFGVGYLTAEQLPVVVYVIISNITVFVAVIGIKYFIRQKGIAGIPHDEGNILLLFPLAGIILYYAILCYPSKTDIIKS